MMERVEQLEEKVKRLEGELARTTKVKKTSIVRVFGEGYCFNIWCGCSRYIIAFVITILTGFAEK